MDYTFNTPRGIYHPSGDSPSKDKENHFPAHIEKVTGDMAKSRFQDGNGSNAPLPFTGHLKKQSELFKASIALKHLPQPLNPHNPHAENLNDVYMTNFHENRKLRALSPAPREVVFKPGNAPRGAVFHNRACYEIASLIGLEETVAPAKKGTADVVARHEYKTYTSANGKDRFLIQSDNGETNGGLIPMRDFNKHPNGDITYFDEDLQEEEYLTPTDSGTYIKNLSFTRFSSESKFTLLLKDDDDETEVVVPDNQLIRIGSQDEVAIDNKQYTLDEEDGLVTLTPKDPTDSNEQENLSFVRLVKPAGRSDLVPTDYLAPEDAYFKFDKKNSIVTADDGKHTLEKKGDGYFVSEKPEEFHVVIDKDGKAYLSTSAEMSKIEKDNKGDFILYNGQKYRVTEDNHDSIKVIGYHIIGMVQSKVENTYTKTEDGENIDVASQSPATKDFFNRIDSSSFMKAFLATIILRPQDGKVGSLNVSNVLFQAIPNSDGSSDPTDTNVKLMPVLIDLDETLPEKNDYSTDLEISQEGKAHVHVVRNGLMAFPQVSKALTADQRSEVVGMMETIISKRGAIEKQLSKYAKSGHADFNTSHVNATIEIIDKMKAFLQTPPRKNWSLGDLFFTIFPEYHEQWKLLDQMRGGMSAAQKADIIGHISLEMMQQMIENEDS